MKKINVLSCLLLLIAASLVNADVTIRDMDVVDDHYVYQLSFEDMATSDVFNRDRHDSRNVRVIQEIRNGKPTGIRAVALWPKVENRTSEISFRFDFSKSSYRPIAMKVRDNFSLGTGDTMNVVTEYSTDGFNWKTIRTTQTPAQFAVDMKETEVALDDPKEVFYRVTMTVSPADDDSYVTQDDANQWNRTHEGWEDRDFKIDFQLKKK